MKKEEVMFQAPPRLLMGVAFLFWGAMQDEALAGLIAAILFEARHWTGLRWAFGEKGFARAWQLCILLLIVSVVGVFQLEDHSPTDFLRVLAWLPFILMPIGLAQQYSSDRGVPMTTFSFIARRKLALDRKLGRPVQIRPFQLGYPFLALILIATGMAVSNLKFYATGIVILMGVALFRLADANRRPKAWGVAFVVSCVMAVGMVSGIMAIYDHVVDRISGSRGTDSSDLSSETRTQIGNVTNLQQSQDIVWRYFEGGGPQPERLRLAAYNRPENNNWKVKRRSSDYVEQISPERSGGGDFEKLFKGGESEYFYDESELKRNDFAASGRVEGLVLSQNLIPVPLGTRRLARVSADYLAANSMGTTQINQPKNGAVGIELSWDPEVAAVGDLDPSENDLEIPSNEQKGVRDSLREIGGKEGDLEHLPSAEEIRDLGLRLQHHFATKFKYSPVSDYQDLKNPVSHFLNSQRIGHCEYFASATTLLMRSAGIPARYVVGYVVREKGSDPGEWIIRGTHAHAWCQVYLGGTWVLEKSGEREAQWRCRGGHWIEVDLTPAGWLYEESPGLFQKLSDGFQGLRTGLILWFARPLVSSVMGWILAIAGLLLVAYLLVKMITTHRSGSLDEGDSWDARVRAANILANFERWLARRIGARPDALTMAAWLRRHLPPGEESLIRHYELLVFGSGGANEEDLASFREQVARVKKKISRPQKTPEP